MVDTTIAVPAPGQKVYVVADGLSTVRGVFRDRSEAVRYIQEQTWERDVSPRTFKVIESQIGYPERTCTITIDRREWLK